MGKWRVASGDSWADVNACALESADWLWALTGRCRALFLMPLVKVLHGS